MTYNNIFFYVCIRNKSSRLWHKANINLLYICMFMAGINKLAVIENKKNTSQSKHNKEKNEIPSVKI